MPIAWQTVTLPFTTGLETKQDPRFSSPPTLDIARDVQFDNIGGVQPRLPYAAMSNAIFGGGTLSNCRYLAVVNDELCVFTDTAFYSWSADLSAWVLRDTHLAATVDESQAFSTPGDQVDADRAELNGIIVYAWTEGAQVFAAALSKTTGAVLVSPTAVSSATGRPRLVALATKILLFTTDASSHLAARAIDPAAPGTAIGGAGTNLQASDINSYYDVVRAGTQDLCVGAYRRTTTTAYTAFSITPGLAATLSNKARTCDGPIAVATTPDGTQTQIVRGNGTNIQGDLLTTSTLADVFTNQAIGTTSIVQQITAAFASASSATAFWTGLTGETANASDFTIKMNTVTTANVVGTQSNLRHRLGIASRAFTYSGHAYLWGVFAGESGTSATGNTSAVRAQLQNTYFLYRDDGHLAARVADGTAGGFSSSVSHLPGVSLTSGSAVFSWCGTRRRIVELGGQADHRGYSARTPLDITFTFDTNDARRSVRLGKTLYVAGPIPLQYDGVQLAEVGFLIYPWYFEPTNGGPGAIPAGTYTWKSTYRWQNAQGEIDRSTTATGMSLAVGASQFVFLNYVYLHVTRKIAPRPVAIDFWRTVVSPQRDTPFNLTSSLDPNAGIVNNGYVINDDTGVGAMAPLPDNFTDAILTTKQIDPESGDVLEFLAPPGAKLIIASASRLFIGAVSGDPDRIWYSRQRAPGEVTSFHDSLVIDIPRNGGDITALALLNETLIVFRQTAVYDVPGQGFDNAGGGQNYGPANQLSIDVGAVSQEAVCTTPIGVLFKSRKGWYLLDRGWNAKYVGAAVAAFDSDTVLATSIVEGQHQVRILTNNRMIVWDYWNTNQDAPNGQWGEWTVNDGLHALMWNGSHVYLTSTGPKIQQSTYSSLTYGYDVETSWVKPVGDQQGEFSVKSFAVLGEYRSSHLVRVRVARDYQYDGAGNVVYFDDSAWTPTPTTVGSALQVKHSPSLDRAQSFKVRLTAVTEQTRASLVTTALSPQVTTSGSVWNATWSAAAGLPGLMGNGVTMSVAFESGAAQLIDVRDHFTYDLALARWREDVNNIGVRIVGVVASPPTVAAIEAAISNVTTGTKLATLTSADAAPTKTLNVSGMSGLTSTATFSGGAYGVPSGEAARLTGIAAEIGVRPGINKRLPPAQKVA